MKVSEPRHWEYDRSVDDIGSWSEVKLEILKRYAVEYSRILSNQKNPSLKHIYIDAFAGGGVHHSRNSGKFIQGSPLNALNIEPPFKGYHFIELEKQKVESLEKLAGQRNNVHIYQGDCNAILINEVFPQVRFEDYKLGLCLLDPYGLHLDWRVIQAAGQSRSIEVFINFPIQDINRNVLRRDPDSVALHQKERMNLFWGDESWREIAYKKRQHLFGYNDEKVPNIEFAEAFRKRLKEVAGFKDVPKPCPMKNSKNAIVYYLFFASHNAVAKNIVKHIFEKFGGN